MIEILYDGDCPFCARYVAMTRLRDSVGTVRLIDARSGDPLVATARAEGFDLNEGMLARYGDRWWFGPDCVHLLAMLSSRSGWFNRLTGRLFANPATARRLYPWMRAGRNAALRVLGRPRIA
jgi:predicted DCC family thiol-disulfide oxidoreductase YuxK